MTRMLNLSALAALALATACSSGTSGTSGTTGAATAGNTSGTGSSTGTGTGTATAGGSTTGSSVYCNGVELTDSSSPPVTVYLATYPKTDDIRLNCDTAFSAFAADAGATIPSLSGIIDINSNSAQTLFSIFPAACGDVNAGTDPTPSGTPTQPSGSVSIASLRASDGAGLSASTVVYGIVTWVEAPYASATSGVHSGNFYIQDPPLADGGLADKSGIIVYWNKAQVSDGGPVNYPSSGLAIGDAITLSGVAWSPYKGQQQLEVKATAPTVTVIGQSALPPAVTLTASDIAAAAASATTAAAFPYAGMRVTQVGPDTLVNGCPIALQSPATGG